MNVSTNTAQPKTASRPMRGPALTTAMKQAKYRYDGLDPMTDEPRQGRKADGQILTQANRQELLDNRPEVKAARMAALKEAKTKRKARKGK